MAIVPIGDRGAAEALVLADRLRRAGVTVELTYRGNLSKRMKRANQVGAVAAVIVGDDELEKRVVTVRALDTGEQREVALDDLARDLLRDSGA